MVLISFIIKTGNVKTSLQVMISKTKKIPFVDDKRCLYVSVMTISQRAYSSNSVKERIFYFALLYKVDVGHSVSLSLMHEISLFHQAFQIIVMYNFLFNHRFLITHGLLYLSVAVAIFFSRKRSKAWFSDTRLRNVFVQKSSDRKPVNIAFW